MNEEVEVNMAYNTQELLNRAKEIIPTDANIVFLEDVYVELGISKDTFFNHFPTNSEQSDEIKRLLQENKTKQKKKLRDRWIDSPNATLSLCAYKLMSNENERKLLADRTEIDPIKPLSEIQAISIEELKKGKKALEKAQETNE